MDVVDDENEPASANVMRPVHRSPSTLNQLHAAGNVSKRGANMTAEEQRDAISFRDTMRTPSPSTPPRWRAAGNASKRGANMSAEERRDASSFCTLERARRSATGRERRPLLSVAAIRFAMHRRERRSAGEQLTMLTNGVKS